MSDDGTFISYAQHGEDVILWRALGDRTGVFYVDVGAFHPTHDSVTRALYERGWRGINIEAQPDRLAAFEDERPQDTNLALAVGDRDGTVSLTLPENPGWASTLDPALTGSDPSTSRTIEVPIRRLDTLLAELGVEHVDVLKVDVEGAEPAVIRGLLGGRVRPLVCVVEGVAPGVGRTAGDEAVALLVEAGYQHCLFDGLNHYLTTDPSLQPALSAPANPVDTYTTDLTHRLLDERLQLHATIAALAAENLGLRGVPPTAPSPAAPVETVPGIATEAASEEPAAPEQVAPELAQAAVGEPSGPESAAFEALQAAAEATLLGEFALVDVTADRVPGFDGGDLPLPVPDETPLGAVPPPVPEPDLPPHLDPAVRAERRRATFIRLLRDEPTPLPRGSNTASFDRLLTLAVAKVPPSDAIPMLYRAILGREADRDGMSGWTRRLDAGAHLIDLARDLAGSAEALACPPAQREQVRADLIAWESLAAVTELGAAAWHPDRPYAQGSIAHEVFVRALYEVTFQRLPSAGEAQFEIDKLAAGAGREWLLRAFAANPAVQARVLGAAGHGLRGRLRRRLNARHYVQTFRELVLAAESRQIAQFLINLYAAGPTLQDSLRLPQHHEER